MLYEKAALMSFIGTQLCRILFFDKVHAQGLKRDSCIDVFLWVLPKFFRTFFLQKHLWATASAKYPFLFVTSTLAKKMFPLSLAILNIFEANTVNWLGTALFGGPRQSAVTKLIYC